MTRHSLLAAAVVVGASLAFNANAQDASTSFDVTITITSTCSINTPAATDVEFGSNPSTNADIDAAGQLNVNCTPGTSYNVALNAGLNGASIDDRAMAGPDDVLVPYQLYRDPAFTEVWGEAIGTETVAGTGTGEVQVIPVHGLVPSANFPVGTYIDTITATVSY